MQPFFLWAQSTDALYWLQQPWHWAFSGFMIVVVMYLLLKAGGQFGVSSTFRSICSIGGAGKLAEFFRFDWKAQQWNLAFAGGAIIGGWIASTVLAAPDPIDISLQTQDALRELGFSAPSQDYRSGFLPPELFSLDALSSLRGLTFLIGGGFLIGFGTRWAGGCTSGHAISGLANLQWPSLVAVIGFFIGGLIMTHLLFPIIF